MPSSALRILQANSPAQDYRISPCVVKMHVYTVGPLTLHLPTPHFHRKLRFLTLGNMSQHMSTILRDLLNSGKHEITPKMTNSRWTAEMRLQILKGWVGKRAPKKHVFTAQLKLQAV